MIDLIEATDTGIVLFVKIIPNASRTEIVGQFGDRVKVKVSASPEKGKANKALIKLLAKETGIVGSRFEVVSGTTSRKKRLNIADGDNALLSQLVEWSKTLSAKN